MKKTKNVKIYSNMPNSLETLFSFVSPEQLRRSVLEIFFAWLTETKELPKNYRQISEDVLFLLKMLEQEETGTENQQETQNRNYENS